MSQKRSIQKKSTNNLKTRAGRRVNACYSGLFRCAENQSVTETVLLYNLVFISRKAVLLSILLCLCFLSQPFQQVFASDNETTSSVIPTNEVLPPEISQTATLDSLDYEIAFSEEIESTNNMGNETAIVTEEVSEINNLSEDDVLLETPDSNESGLSDAGLETETVNSEENQDDNSNIENETSGETSEILTNDESTKGTEGALINGTSSDDIEGNTDGLVDEIFDENNDELLADETELLATNENLVSVVKSDSSFEFNRDECTRIDDGSFYCQKNDSDKVIDNSLISAPDVDGDLEIYLFRDGGQIQITNNIVDDASPFYDEISKTIVWHRLVNDRYQIISYDVKTGEETQLTNTSVNNMQPTRSGEYIVWQRWVNDNWEIILFNNDTERQITDSSRHDIAPHIRGPLVIWNSRSNDGTQSLMTYDINDRTFTTIADGDGVSVSNPRMVVMYEALYENGDKIMKGFDVVTGEIIPIESVPQSLPEELPDADSTGETRALIQNKPTTKQTEIVNDLLSSGSSSPPVTPDILSEGTLDLRPTTTSEAVFEEISGTSTTNFIPDLVLPPINATNTVSNGATSTQIDSE